MIKKLAKKAGQHTRAKSKNGFEWAKRHKFEAALIGALLLISITAHAWNMFDFPYYENDEATYTSRAWAFVTEGQLDVYTYRYDHAPLGWMLIGFWQVLTGGTLIFESLLTSGRVFMLLIHIASTILIYILGKRFSGGSRLAAALAVLFFALSPVAIYFQRRILLDNIMTFWLLLSLFYATHPGQRLKNYVLSGLFFGIAVLTKLNAVFFAPAILLIVWLRAHKQHRLHASLYWCMVTGIVIIGFFLYAFLKGELLSAPLDADGNPTHVSVVDTFTLQLGRGDFAWPWTADSSFVQNVKSWMLKDWSVLIIGALATLGITAYGWMKRKTQPYILILAVLIWLYVAFLARGKLVLDLYIVPLIPLLALAIGVGANVVYGLIDKLLLKRIFLVVLVGLFVVVGLALPTKHYTNNETSNQMAAMEWVQKNLPKDAVIAADNYLYPYLAQERNYKNVSYFFTAEYDPEIRKLYDDDWRNIEYLVLTHEVVKQIKTGTVPRMKQVLDHAELLADFQGGTSSYNDLPNYVSTNGDWAQVYKTRSRSEIVLQDSWQHFKSEFVRDYGQIVDTSNDSLTSSGGQATGMYRAVLMDDEAMFDGFWQWSKDHLRYRTDDKLLSWKWQKTADGSYVLGDTNTVCDADQLIAYSLFLADDKWPGNGYGEEAAVHAADWWRKCTFTRAGQLYVDSSADGSQDIKLVNPGYFRPAIYRFLSAKLPDLPWTKLIDDGYALLGRVQSHYGLIPDWTVVNLDGSISSAKSIVGDAADSFGFDALQLVPNLVEEYVWPNKDRTQALLVSLRESAAGLASSTESASAYAAVLLIDQALESGEPADRQLAYENTVFYNYKAEEGYWVDPSYFRDQIWLWQWHEFQDIFTDNQKITLR